MKAMSTHLLQRDTLKITPENGIVEQESTQPVSNHMIYMDLNGTIKEEPVAQPIFYHLSSIDLNGTSHPDSTDHAPPVEAKMHDVSSVVISKDDLQKIQVFHSINYNIVFGYTILLPGMMEVYYV